MMTLSHLHPHVSRIPGGTLHGQEDESWQHKAVVKDDGGAGGLTECSAALKRWMFSRLGAKTINVFRACLGAQLTICAQK